MKSRPFFSVVIPLFNKEDYIVEALESVLVQSFKDFEVIVVDDGSTDEGGAKLSQLTDPRLKIIRQENKGVSSARNAGILGASGEFIAFLDADDSWTNSKLQEHYVFHRTYRRTVWSCSDFYFKGAKIGPCNFAGGNIDPIELLESGVYIWTGTVVISREIFLNKSFLFNENYQRSEDLELWYKLICAYDAIGFINKKLAYYNIGVDEDSLTSTSLSEDDFSFVYLLKRVDSHLSRMKSRRKERLIKVVKRKILYGLLQIYIYSPGKVRKCLQEVDYLPFYLRCFLKSTTHCPRNLKRVSSKLILFIDPL